MASGSRPTSFSGASTASDPSDRFVSSRFVEGSMNDRSSRAPPVAFLGAAAANLPAADRDRGEDAQHEHTFSFGYNLTRRSLQLARPSFSSFRGGASASATGSATGSASGGTSATTSNTSSSVSSVNTTGTTNTTSTTSTSTTATTATTTSTSSSGTLRRPRSFLAPIWDGVAKRLHRRSRTTFQTDNNSKNNKGGGDVSVEDQPCEPPVQDVPPPSDFSDRPSPDEVFASYQHLMQSGFFSKRAIPATRQGLSGGPRAVDANAAANAAAVAAAMMTTSPEPVRYPARPPTPPSFYASGTPLSPVAPSPAATPQVITTPRGTKRIRTVDVDTDGQGCNGLVPTAASEAPVSSPTRSPRKISHRLRKSSRQVSDRDREPVGGNNSQLPSAALPSRTTRSSQTAQNVQVHQTRPPLPVSMSYAPTMERDAAVVVSSTAGRKVATAMRKDANYNQEPPKKRRSQGPAVVLQVQEATSSLGDSHMMGYDEDLHAPSVPQYHKPLRPRNSATAMATAHQEATPISFHYPQRVRVRQPMQAQIVEIKASSAGHRKRGHVSAPALAPAPAPAQAPAPAPAPTFGYDRPGPLVAQHSRNYQNRYRRPSHGKIPLSREADVENQVPVWRD